MPHDHRVRIELVGAPALLEAFLKTTYAAEQLRIPVACARIAGIQFERAAVLPLGGPVLYFSSFRAGGYATEGDGPVAGDSDIYVSESHAGVFGAARLVTGVNSAVNDAQPNVRRDGLEIFFFSNRAGTLGGPDIYAATRPNTRAEWSPPFNLGENVNTSAAETRPSLSWDGRTLYFGSTRPGGEGDSDIFITTRARAGGPN